MAQSIIVLKENDETGYVSSRPTIFVGLRNINLAKEIIASLYDQLDSL